MAQDKKGFILYADQKELFDQLPNEKAGELIKHIFSYVNDDDPQTEDLLIKLAFTPIKQQLKRDLKKFEETKKQRSDAGKRSAEVRKAQRDSTPLTSVQRSSTKATVKENVTVTVNDNVKVIDIKKEKEVFNFRKSLIAFGFNEKLVDDWMKVRKTKKATNTETALNSFLNECKRSNLENDSILQLCIERDWKGFKNEWLENKQIKNNDTNKPKSRLDRFIAS
tara:strand:- start:416 stop:1084 length:669 start_codon:yes stop_codon:yes gene_type:complete